MSESFEVGAVPPEDDESSEFDAYIDSLVEMIRSLVAGQGKTISEAHDRLKSIRLPEDDINKARLLFEEQMGNIRRGKRPWGGIIGQGPRDHSWYAGESVHDRFWPRVKGRLSESLGEDIASDLGSVTDKIVSVLRSPGTTSFSTRGLVLGYVQSGKTTSFISLIAKAADSGYRCFIVLSGVTDNLRSQTQARVDELLVGLSTEEKQDWFSLTDTDRDFQAGFANAASTLQAGGNLKVIGVVKKNPSRLRSLNSWLDTAGSANLQSLPILIIDDEADQASIDVGRNHITIINRLIRTILSKPKVAYVAYTATPFANLLIRPELEDPTSDISRDLYPQDFIFPLPMNEGYFGSEKLFGLAPHSNLGQGESPGLDLIREVPFVEASLMVPPRGPGAVYSWEPTVSPALRNSILWFFVATATRRARGHVNAHSTMLIHNSMLAEGHSRTAAAVRVFVKQVELEVAQGGSVVDEMRDLYESEAIEVPAAAFGNVTIRFEEVSSFLPTVIEETRIIVDNYRSVDRLIYDPTQASTVIVVGGNTLSRGLTLEGLCSSYFVRAASAYDTLLQMGRWFGYRRGYEDLCRIWMTNELRDWFADLSMVEAEIREEIAVYDAEGLTPAELAVRIRSHPSLAITRAAAMRNARQASMSYGRSRPQTTLFEVDKPEVLALQRHAVATLVEASIAEVGEFTFRSGVRGFKDVPVSIVRAFLQDYPLHPEQRQLDKSTLIPYLDAENEAGSLERWNVVFSEGDTGQPTIDVGLATELKTITRTKIPNYSIPGTANLRVVASGYDRGLDVDKIPSELRLEVETRFGEFKDDFLVTLKDGQMPGVGLIVIYPIDKDSRPRKNSNLRVQLDAPSHLLAFSIYFPSAVSQSSTQAYWSADLSNLRNEDLSDELNEAEKILDS